MTRGRRNPADRRILMAKLSAAHQAAVDVKNQEARERLAYHHILTAIVRGSGKWGGLVRVGSAYHEGDSWVWQMTFSPRLRDAILMETFDSAVNGDKSVRCFFLNDVARAYEGQSFDSKTVTAKIQALYFHAVEMQRVELNRAA
jgi:hypothetical protein